MPPRRAEFSEGTKRKIGERVNYLCSRPDCRRLTKASHTDASSVITQGQACHINAASPGGPRYDPQQIAEARVHAGNGIWLCLPDAHEIDTDETRFPAELLRRWRADTEAWVAVHVTAGTSFQPPPLGVDSSLSLASAAVTSWPQTLPDGWWIERPELDRLLQFVETEPKRPLAVLGGPGSGKSALLGRFATLLQARGTTVLAVKADQLPRDVDSLEKLASALQLKELPTESLYRASKTGKAVLIVDQLDALCDLIDLHTRRLEVLLSLALRCSELESVHIVISSRTFEFNHDARFRRLELDSIELQLPSLAETDRCLDRIGIGPSQLPVRLRELLQVPHNLAIYLRVLPRRDLDAAIRSQHSLMEIVWNERVVPLEGIPRPTDLAIGIAVEMAEREELWLPVASFDSARPSLDRLIATGIMALNATATRVGFTHQSLFEFCRARGFLKNNVLADYVVAHQHALFVRPVMWSSLVYLRDADPKEYGRTVRRLLSADIRRHVRDLLLEFMGTISEPTSVEVVEVSRLLSQHHLRRSVLVSIGDSFAWFKALSGGLVAALMREEPAAMMPLLATALVHEPDEVAALLEAHWLPSPPLHRYAAVVLANARAWGPGATKVALRIAVSAEAGESEMRGVLWAMARLAPREAPKVLVESLRKAEVSLDPEESESEDVGAEPAARAIRAMKRRKPYEAQLRLTELIPCLQEVSKAATEEFASALLPWFADMAAKMVASDEASQRSRYFEDYSLETQLSRSDHRESLVDVLGEAISTLAASHSPRFEILLEAHQGSDLMAVHRLFGTALAQSCHEFRGLRLRYLLEDPRRLCIGDLNGADAISRQLLSGIPADSAPADLLRLEQTIFRSSPYPIAAELPADGKHARSSSNRRHRLRLLLSLPDAIRGTEVTKRINELVTSFPEYAAGVPEPRTPGMSLVRSAMVADQMHRAADKHILNLFDELEDATEWDHPRRALAGGSVAASREFSTFAKSDPGRAANLIRRFDPERQARPAAYGIEGLVEAGYDRAETEALVCECDARGFRTQAFRSDVARAIAKLIRRGETLSRPLVAVLESWLSGDWDDEGKGAQADEASDRGSRPVLWQQGGIVALPGGSYPVLECLTRDYLSRQPPEPDAWLALLGKHVDHSISEAAWRATARYFGSLPRNEHAVSFLARLFERFPRLLFSAHGVSVIASASWWAPDVIVAEWCRQLRLQSAGRQAWGELVGLLATRERAPGWAVDAVDDVMHRRDECAQERLGLAFSLAHLWPHPMYRARVTPRLKELFETANEALDEALSHCFDADSAILDRDTVTISECATQRPRVLLAGKTGRAFDFILELVGTRPELAANLCEAVLASWSSSDSRLHRGTAHQLVDVSLTLQRLDDPLRRKGLDLFEQLLDLGAYETTRALEDLDGRRRR